MVMTTIKVYCSSCSKIFNIEVRREDYEDWIGGKPMDKCFPYLLPPDRYILMTGECLKCREEEQNGNV